MRLKWQKPAADKPACRAKASKNDLPKRHLFDRVVLKRRHVAFSNVWVNWCAAGGRAGGLHHAESGHIEVEDRFLFLALGLILLTQPDDGAHRLGIEAFSPPHESVV